MLTEPRRQNPTPDPCGSDGQVASEGGSLTVGFGGSDCGKQAESPRGARGSPRASGRARGTFRQKEAVSPVWPPTTQYNLEHFPGANLPDPAGAGHLRGAGVAGWGGSQERAARGGEHVLAPHGDSILDRRMGPAYSRCLTDENKVLPMLSSGQGLGAGPRRAREEGCCQALSEAPAHGQVGPPLSLPVSAPPAMPLSHFPSAESS